MSVKKGIDVSYAQGNIDFNKIDKKEIDFVIIRSSYGWEENQKDDKFERNIKGFQSLGIPCGVYHYSYAESVEDAVKEAKYCIKCIKGHKLQLPVFIDMEESRIARHGKRICTDIAKAFCDYMKKSGYNAGVYLNRNWLENYVNKSEIIEKYDLWLAQWEASKPSYNCDIWQYNVGKEGSVNGISGRIDLNYMYRQYNINSNDTDKNTSSSKTDFKKGDEVKVINPVNYDNGERFIVYDGVKYTVIEAVRDRIVIGIDGNVTAAIAAKNIRKVSASSGKKTILYTVQKGDTLTGIANRYKTTVEKIVNENGIKNPDLIFGGQILKITL